MVLSMKDIASHVWIRKHCFFIATIIDSIEQISSHAQ